MIQEKPSVQSDKEPKKPKSALRKSIGWVIYLIIIGLLMYATPKMLSAYLQTDTPIAAITSGSMWPVLKKGDLILVKAVEKNNLAVGDIIVFKNPRGYTIHRIIELSDTRIVTKGDANNVSDAPISYEDVVGRTVNLSEDKPMRVPRLGFVSIWLSGLNKSG